MSAENNMYESDGDTSDEDYVPGGEDCAQLSEVESDGDAEDPINSDSETANTKHRKRKGKTKAKSNKKQRIEEPVEENQPEEEKQLTEEEQKKKTDSLWADFLKDTDFKPKPKAATVPEKKEIDSKPKSKTTIVKETKETPKTSKDIEKSPPKEKPKAPVILEFAGEKIDKEGNVLDKSQTSSAPAAARRSSGGMASVLSQLGKKQKLSTLEKSKLDWDKFKRDENIGDELKSYNMGKNGYLDRQDFLQRADLRQFELEKEARAIRRTHRS